MTITQLFQLYAPLVGLLALAFWTGVLSQRVKQLEDTAKDLKAANAEGSEVFERLVRLEVNMENAVNQLGSLDRGMQGVQRQLGNLMHKGGAIQEFGS